MPPGVHQRLPSHKSLTLPPMHMLLLQQSTHTHPTHRTPHPQHPAISPRLPRSPHSRHIHGDPHPDRPETSQTRTRTESRALLNSDEGGTTRARARRRCGGQGLTGTGTHNRQGGAHTQNVRRLGTGIKGQTRCGVDHSKERIRKLTKGYVALVALGIAPEAGLT